MRCIACQDIVPDRELVILNYDRHELCRKCYVETFSDVYPLTCNVLTKAKLDINKDVEEKDE